MNKLVGIVLVNYHDYAKRFLAPCRDSLRQQSYSLDDFQVYIVDNDSSEETFSYLQQEYPEAIILKRNDGNYCAANNLGFKEAIKNGAQYLVALNMDTEVEADWLKELVLSLDTNREAGIAQSKILLYQKGEAAERKINTLGNIIHFLGFGFTSAYQTNDFVIEGYPEINGYASGCSFIIRKEVFNLVNGLNEEFYMYHDDVELSLKTKLADWKVILAPKSVVFHKYEFERSVRMFYYMERNRYLTLFIFSSKRYLALIFLPLFFMALAMFFFSLINGSSKEIIKVYSYFLKSSTWGKIRAERLKVANFSKVKFSQIAINFKAKIEFQEISNFLLRCIVNPLMSAYWFLIKRFI